MLMFQALREHGSVPQSKEEVLQMCHTTLAEVIGARGGPEVARALLDRLEQVLLQGDRSGTDIPIDVDMDPEPSITMVMPTVWREPVSTVIVSGQRLFADQLYGCLGAARVKAHTSFPRPVESGLTRLVGSIERRSTSASTSAASQVG